MQHWGYMSLGTWLVYAVVRFILFTFMVVYIYIGTRLLKCASCVHETRTLERHLASHR